MNTAAVWLLDNGVQPFPLKHRGKEPATGCKWQQYSCDRATAERLQNYGVRLTLWFGVVDSDTPESEAWVAAHLPATPFMVRTGRGWHRYYRLNVQPPRFIHRAGLTIEFRSDGQYVVGPGSIHPSGHVYTANDWSWDIRDVPFFPKDFLFDDRAPEQGGPRAVGRGDDDDYEFPSEVSSGERHHELFKLLRSFKGRSLNLVNDADKAEAKATARYAVSQANQHFCKPPLKEDHTFETWFRRGWDNPDRPMDLLGDRVPINLPPPKDEWF